eukprot:2941971-Ditylum_brightwellii.AAC.1
MDKTKGEKEKTTTAMVTTTTTTTGTTTDMTTAMMTETMATATKCTRMHFQESKSEATLTAKGDFAYIKHGVKQSVFSKGTKLCLSIFSYSKEDIKKINKNSRH